jgi:hypothetical protein
MDAAHQRLLHFITDSAWDDHVVRLAAARYTHLKSRAPARDRALLLTATPAQLLDQLPLLRGAHGNPATDSRTRA